VHTSITPKKATIETVVKNQQIQEPPHWTSDAARALSSSLTGEKSRKTLIITANDMKDDFTHENHLQLIEVVHFLGTMPSFQNLADLLKTFIGTKSVRPERKIYDAIRKAKAIDNYGNIFELLISSAALGKTLITSVNAMIDHFTHENHLQLVKVLHFIRTMHLYQNLPSSEGLHLDKERSPAISSIRRYLQRQRD